MWFIAKEKLKERIKLKSKSPIAIAKWIFSFSKYSILEISEKNLKYIKEAVNADGFKKLAYQKAIEEEIENRSRKSIYLFGWDWKFKLL